MIFDDLLYHELMVHFQGCGELLLGLKLMVELVFVVDHIAKNAVSLEKGHEPNQP